MKKILLAFDGGHFSESAFEFVRRLNEVQPVLVTGLFVPLSDYADFSTYSAAIAFSGAYIPLIDEEEIELTEKNITIFQDLCRKNGIVYRVHKDLTDFTIPELKKETRFADAMVISGELFYKKFIESEQYDHLRDLLHIAECPVLVLPQNYQFPDFNILAYDGSEESVYAIKQFAYVFPGLAANKTFLVYADNEKDFPLKDYIVELATQHYKDLTFYKLETNPKKFFSTWVMNEKGCLLVTGSYSRSAVSQIFKKSFAADIIRDHKVPVFIAHR